jgi:nucleotide-binding universal stress UspA family protein
LNAVDTHPILLCYDGSPGAKHAIKTAGALFPGHAAVVLHVWSPVALIASRYGGIATISTYDDSGLQEAATELAGQGARAASDAGLAATAEACETTYAGTTHDLLEAASRHDAALIVLGARGLSTFKAILLGSVSHGVAQHAERPVLIVPPATRDKPTPTSAERSHASV